MDFAAYATHRRLVPFYKKRAEKPGKTGVFLPQNGCKY